MPQGLPNLDDPTAPEIAPVRASPQGLPDLDNPTVPPRRVAPHTARAPKLLPDVETPPNVRPNPLREGLSYLDLPLAFLESVGADARDTLQHPERGSFWGDIPQGDVRMRHNEQLARDLGLGPDASIGDFFHALTNSQNVQRVADYDIMFRRGALQRIIRDPNADPYKKQEAQHFLDHPYEAGAFDFLTEWLNPATYAGGEVARVLVAPYLVGAGDLLGQSRLAFPAVDAAMTTGENIARRVGSTATGALLGAAARVPGSIGRGIRGALDRYSAAGLPQRGGSGFVTSALAAHAAPQHAAAVAENEVRGIFDGLTTAQKREVERLSTLDAEGRPIAERNPEVPEPKHGPNLAARAASSRSLIQRQSNELDELGLRTSAQQELLDPNVYWPHAQYGERNPVFVGQELSALSRAAGEPLGDELPLIRSAQQRYSRGGSGQFRASVPKGARRVGPDHTILNPDVEADLHPRYDPAYQLEVKAAQNARAIANERSRRMLEEVPSVNPKTGAVRTANIPGEGQVPLRARMPEHYTLESGGKRLVFGSGTAGKRNMELYIQRVAKARAAGLARKDPDMQAFAEARGVNPEDLGSRTIANRAVRPISERLSEAARTGERIGKVTAKPLNAVLRATSRGAEGLQRAGGRMEEALGENLSRAASARTEAKAAEESAYLYAADEEALTRLEQEATTPARRALLQVARQLRDRERGEWQRDVSEYQRVADTVTSKSIKPSWVYQNGKWELAGEYDDVPRRFLDTSNKPKMPPVSTAGIIARVDGNLDDVADRAGMDGEQLREWMRNNGRSPRLGQYIEQAEDQVTRELASRNDAEVESLLDRLGMPGATLRTALKRVRATVDGLRADADHFGNEASARMLAERELGPAARATVAATERAQQRFAEASISADAMAAGLTREQAERVQALTTQFERRAATSETAAEFQRTASRYYETIFERIAQRVRAEAPKVPEGYTREATLGLGSPSGRDMALDDSFAKFFKGQERLSPQEADDVKGLWRAFQVFNRLARMGIVMFPNVHGVNNLGMHYLAEGGSPLTMGEILAGRYRPSADLADRAYAAGAATDWSRQTFSLGEDTAHATTAIGERANMAAQKAGEWGAVVRPAVNVGLRLERVYNRMNGWLFRNAEQGYAIDLFDRFTQQGMDDGEAAMRVRNTLGRYDNLTPKEIKYNLDRIFFFYPWMKTVVPFWAKKGILDPRWWSAPVGGVMTTNQIQGYDDPSRPFTLTAGKRADGSWRTITLPLPQRVTENIAEAGRIPFDLARGRWSDAMQDAKAPFNWVAGHFNPLLQVGRDAYDAVTHGATAVAPWNTFRVNPGDSPGEQTMSITANLLTRVLAPVQRVEEIGQDPIAGLATVIAGGYDSSTPTASQKRQQTWARHVVDSLYHYPIAAAKANGGSIEIRGQSMTVDALTRLREQTYQRTLQMLKTRSGAWTQQAVQNTALPAPQPSAMPLPAVTPAPPPSGLPNLENP